MAEKKSVKASGTIKRERKPIFDHASLTKEQLEELKAASTALASFISVKEFLASGTTAVAPKAITDSINHDWSVFFRKIKAIGLFKSKRKERSAEQQAYDKKKGQLLILMNKTKRDHGEDSKEHKVAKTMWSEHMTKSPKKQK